MQRPKQQSHFRPHQRKYQQLTSKIPAKTPLKYRERKLAGQSSALPANRARSKDVNYFKVQRPTYRLDSLHKSRTMLKQQQIKNSTLYKLLQQQIQNLVKNEQYQIQKLQEVQIQSQKKLKKNKQKQLTDIKSEQHAIKLQIWELRNQTMELKDSIKEEKQETYKLMQELGITEEDLENQHQQEIQQIGNDEQEDEQGQDYDQNQTHENNHINS